MSALPPLRTAALLLLAAAAAVAVAAACEGERASGAGGDAAERGTEAVAQGADPAEGAADAPSGEPAVEALPDGSDHPEGGGVDAAVEVVVDYFSAIARRDFARAYALWGGGGAASGQSSEGFRRGYADTESVSVEIGVPGRVEPAAGSRYVRVPVEIAARLADGTHQCFRGTYTLRRSVVDGATAEQRRWRLDSADVTPCEAGVEEPPSEDDSSAAATSAAVKSAAVKSAAVKSTVERFGERLERVSLLAPAPALGEQIRAEYGPLVTPSLLAAWLADPGSAPGREVSSPWPDRIEVRDVTGRDDGGYSVSGDVVYVTSVEAVEGGAAAREPVELTLVAGDDGGWRIAAYERR